jgi:hypothetical protein
MPNKAKRKPRKTLAKQVMKNMKKVLSQEAVIASMQKGMKQRYAAEQRADNRRFGVGRWYYKNKKLVGVRYARGMNKLPKYYGRIKRDYRITKPVYTTIKHRELVATIGGSGFYQSFVNSINPGMFDTFPWLANMAQSFDQYRFKYLDVEYVPDAGTTTSGTFFMAFNYDPDDSNTVYYNNEETLASYPGAVQNPVIKNGKMILRPKLFEWGKKGWYYIRAGPIPTGETLRLYDAATLYTATDADVKNSLGRVYVNYTVQFKASNPISIPLSSDLDTSLFTGTVNANYATNLASITTEYSANPPVTLKRVLITESTYVNRLQFYNNYRGQLTLYVLGTGLTPGSGSSFIDYETTSAVYSLAYGGSGMVSPNTGVGNTTSQTLNWWIDMYNADYIDIESNVVPTTVTYVQILITPINCDFSTPTLPPSLPKPLPRKHIQRIELKEEKKEEFKENEVKGETDDENNEVVDDTLSTASEPFIPRLQQRHVSFGNSTSNKDMHSKNGNRLVLCFLATLATAQIYPPTLRPTLPTKAPTVVPTEAPTMEHPVRYSRVGGICSFDDTEPQVITECSLPVAQTEFTGMSHAIEVINNTHYSLSATGIIYVEYMILGNPYAVANCQGYPWKFAFDAHQATVFPYLWDWACTEGAFLSWWIISGNAGDIFYHHSFWSSDCSPNDKPFLLNVFYMPYSPGMETASDLANIDPGMGTSCMSGCNVGCISEDAPNIGEQRVQGVKLPQRNPLMVLAN